MIINQTGSSGGNSKATPFIIGVPTTAQSVCIGVFPKGIIVGTPTKLE